MSSSQASAQNSSTPRRALPIARVPQRNPERLRPLGKLALARAAVRQLGRSTFDVVRSACGACVAAIDGVLGGARRGSERLMWWLGYARVDLVSQPTSAPRPLPPRKPHPRLIRRDPARHALVSRPAPVPHDDDEVTGVYDDGTLDGAKTTVALRRLDTENEVTRIAPSNVIPIGRGRAGR